MADDLLNQPLGKYRLLSELGKGGFATVYRALDTTLDRQVALKVLDPLLLRDPTWVTRFQREARAVARLKHPHIVIIHEIGDAGGQLFIAMELIDGPPLDWLIAQRGHLPWQETLDILVHVADALDDAHRQGIVHRDLKPSNILLDPRRGAVLTDFGFARLVGESSSGVSLSGGIVGTPAYIAPEVRRDQGASPATDQYALACIACEMLTGQLLFSGSTPAAVMTKHVMDGPQLPAQWPPGVPAGAAPVLGKALARELGGRYPSAGELVAALRAGGVAPRPQPQPTPVPAGAPIGAPQAPGRTPVVPPPPAPHRKKSSGWLWAVGGTAIIGLAILAILGVWLAGRASRPPAVAGSSPVPDRSDVRTPTPPVPSGGVPAAVSPAGGPAPTATRLPTQTPYPTYTPYPTATGTSQPTYTPQPTYTSQPTNTPVPRLRAADAMEMVLVPSGEFLMGSPAGEGDDDEHPQHRVMLDGFWIDRTEVNNAQYGKCVKAGACRASGCADESNFNGANQPVVCVGWEQAKDYCHWAGGRLPTEAGWEKAARGTDGREYPWGDEEATCERANYDGCVGRTWAVGSKPAGASPYGALDMAGNVQEWVADRYGAGYYARSPQRNPTGPGPDSGDARVVRGGSWNYSRNLVRSAYRDYIAPTYTNLNIGFRCSVSSTSSP